MFKKLSLVIIFCLTLSTAYAVPETKTVKSELPSANEAVSAIFVSAPEQNNSPNLSQLIFKEDLVGVEIEAIRRLIEDPHTSNKDKSIQLVRYTLGDPRVSEVLIKAKKAGIQVTLITDLNPVMVGDFSDIQGKTTSAFSKAKLKDPSKSPGAQIIQDLLNAGFEFKKEIISQPLYQPDLERIPIMHEKALLLKSGQNKTVYFGTANMAPNPRYNRTFEITDPVFFDRYDQHLKKLNDGYQKGKETKELEPEPRTVIQYKDGTEIEMAFTSASYNPNDRIADVLKNNTLNHIILSHFVITHRGFLKSLGEAISKNPEASGFAVADDRFAAVKGWGLSPALAGIDVLDPYHRKVTGLTPSAFDRIESFVYQRPALDPKTGKIRIERSENGPPVARHVWHDKTTLIDFTDPQGERKTALFSGSFNLSNNVANSEFQAQFNLSRDSWIRKAINHSVKEVVSNEPQWAVPTLEGTLRNAVAILLGTTDIEVPLQKNAVFLDAIDRRDFTLMRKTIKEMGTIETQLNWKLPPKERQERIDRFVKFLDWYERNVPPSKAELEVRTQRTIGMLLVIAQPKLPDHIKATILSKVLDRSQLSIAEQHRLLNEAFKELGLGKINPWSGQISKIFSLEEIISQDFLKTLASSPNTTLAEVIIDKIGQNEFDWKGPSFDSFVSAIESEARASMVSIFSMGDFEAKDIHKLLSALKENRSKLKIKSQLFTPPFNHIVETDEKEALEQRLQKIFESQAKKGVLSAQVYSSNEVLLSALNKIKRGQEGELAEFTIKMPTKPEPTKDCSTLLKTI